MSRWLLASPGLTIRGTAALILHATDGGDSWYYQDPGPDSTVFILEGIDLTDGVHGWAAGGDFCPFNGVILHTESGGE